MQNLPLYVPILFIATTLLTLFFLYKAANNSKTVLVVCLLWLSLQAIVSLSKFYTVVNTFPPRFVLLVLPPLVVILLCFITKSGKAFIDSLHTRTLTILHVVRIPVEAVLFWLFVRKTVPQLMTFEGRNFDILSGLTAPFIFYFGYVRKNLSRNAMLVWNFICLGLLANIVIHAILSAPFPFQKLAFDQPNIAILYFPFIWLPGFIVPAVLLSHLVSIRQLLNKDLQYK